MFYVSILFSLGFIFESGQVRTDPEKIMAISEWPVPENRKQLQWFLRFANFYKCFIRDYSQTALYLTKLISMLRSSGFLKQILLFVS